MHKIFPVIYKEVHQNPRLFLQLEPYKIQRMVQKIPKVTDDDKEKAVLVLRFYQLLYKKYNIHYQDVIKSLQSSYIFDQQKLMSLQKALLRKDYYQSLVILMDFLSFLKERIVSPEKTEAFEDIYHKRHIAAGIPSMYGVYREPKLDALGLYLRLQCLANVLLEQLINSLNIQFITKTTLVKIDKYLRLFIKALQLEGISTEGLDSKTKYLQGALKIKRFSLDQYIDIFRFISRGIQDIIRLYSIYPQQPNPEVVMRQLLARRSVIGGDRRHAPRGAQTALAARDTVADRRKSRCQRPLRQAKRLKAAVLDAPPHVRWRALRCLRRRRHGYCVA